MPVAGVVKKYDPEEKNWAVYDTSDNVQSNIKARTSSKGLTNEDIIGSKPKQYGASLGVKNMFAGVASGMQERLKQTEAPWGMGENFEYTKYGARSWLEKPNRYPEHKNVPVVQPIIPRPKDSLDYERDRIESRDMQERNFSYQPEEQVKLGQQSMEPQIYHQLSESQELPKEGKSYMEYKKEELRRYLAEKQALGAKTEVPIAAPEQQDPSRVYDQQNKEQLKQQMEYELAREMHNMNQENLDRLTEQENHLPQHAKYDYKMNKEELPEIASYEDPSQPQAVPPQPTENIPLDRKQPTDLNPPNIFGIGDKSSNLYTAESKSYGTGTVNRGAIREKIYSRKTPKSNSGGSNIITGEFAF